MRVLLRACAAFAKNRIRHAASSKKEAKTNTLHDALLLRLMHDVQRLSVTPLAHYLCAAKKLT